MAMTIDIKSAVAYNLNRPYTRDQWFAICRLLERVNTVDVLWAHTDIAHEVASYQRQHGLPVDGKLGPQTERHMAAHGLVLDALVVCDYCGEDKRQDELMPADDSGIPICKRCACADDDMQGQGYDAARAVEWAMDRVLDWEAAPSYGGGNYQPDLVRTFWGDDKPRSNWCGAFVASALEAGGVTVPPNTRRGAKRLTRWVAGRGQWVIAPTMAAKYADFADAFLWPSWLRPGDVLCWNRGTLAALRDGEMSWHGHVVFLRAVMPDGGLDIFDGNSRDPKTNKRGQLVRRILGPDEWPHRRKDGLSGLYGVARP